MDFFHEQRGSMRPFLGRQDFLGLRDENSSIYLADPDLESAGTITSDPFAIDVGFFSF